MISVIVPVYNAEKFIFKCVDSLINQTYEDIEIVLVDDGSTDGSLNILNDYAKNDSRIVVVHKENGGLVSAWKAGVSASKGEYLSFVDSDDWVDTNMFEELMTFSTSSEEEVIASDYIIERNKNGILTPEYVFQPIEPGEYKGDKINECVIPNLLGNEHRFITLSRCMKLISSKLIKDNLDYASEEIKMAEDVAIMFPALLDAKRIYIMDHKAYYHYFYNEESMVHKYDAYMETSFEKLLKSLKRAISKKNHDELIASIDRENIFLLLYCVKNEARGNKEHYKENIIKLHKKNKDLIDNTRVSVKDKSNLLLYRALKNPNALNLLMLKMAINIYYR